MKRRSLVRILPLSLPLLFKLKKKKKNYFLTLQKKKKKKKKKQAQLLFMISLLEDFLVFSIRQ
jgi:hypothetical protein